MTGEDTFTRSEHLAWAKERALELVDKGDLRGAFLSMASDFGKHSELSGHSGLTIGARLWFGGFLDTAREMRKWIEDFN